MVKINAHRDNNGNIVITEDDFFHILNCLCNQKFIGEPPPNGDALSLGMQEYYNIQKENQDIIDDCYHQCMDILTKK